VDIGSIFYTSVQGVSLPLEASRDLAETIELRPLCITDLFLNKSVAYLKFIKKFPSIKNFVFLFYFMQLFNADIKIFLEKF
jgi:hypothetical protein